MAIIDELNDPFELLSVGSEDSEVRHVYTATKAAIAQFNGLLCFSGNWRNPVQWSHYADHHRGLCLGFDVIGGLLPVTYTSKRLKPNLATMVAGGATAQKHMLEMLTTKFSHWRYENEYRLLVRLKDRDRDGMYFFPFGKNVVLKEVMVGFNSTISRTELADALGDLAPMVEASKARLAFKTFRIVRQRSEELWK